MIEWFAGFAAGVHGPFLVSGTAVMAGCQPQPASYCLLHAYLHTCCRPVLFGTLSRTTSDAPALVTPVSGTWYGHLQVSVWTDPDELGVTGGTPPQSIHMRV